MKRVYEPASPADGMRVLVDRLWPRGLSKAAARIDLWARELSPSDELRRWYRHEAKKWPEFKRRYRAELTARADELENLARQTRRRKVTLLFGSKEPRLNNAFALKEILASRPRSTASLRKIKRGKITRGKKAR